MSKTYIFTKTPSGEWRAQRNFEFGEVLRTYPVEGITQYFDCEPWAFIVQMARELTPEEYENFKTAVDNA